ncbi:hypothetical protein PoB_001522600 [Plakobranchus ocellatus]|uniref:Uncharacterized protein n=1 Tax=Plakobranchus ocellatus TaxID=259542 RepID=A0AAV3Z2C2_9GAST|nr:hypothetical protein PoB_001522600 [Plakobranchus ocellatus]
MVTKKLWVLSPLPRHLILLVLIASQCQGHMDSAFQDFEEKLAQMKTGLEKLTRQVMLQQFASEQRVRTDGQSGVKAVRSSFHGPMNYYSSSHLNSRYIAMHDHADFENTMGMGVVNVVINGVEFVTRHNDYMLVKQSSTSREFHATEPIQHPVVPPSVLALDSVDDQVEEMRTYFKAFAQQNTTLRDYRPYFKPILCYMEGAWTLDKNIEEPFVSFRHNLDARSWEELHSLVNFQVKSGMKAPKENLAHLPTAIVGMNEKTGEPIYAQWNYRILCSPITQDIPMKHIKQVDDLKYLYPRKRIGKENRLLRSARFVLFEFPRNRYLKMDLLDNIFYKIVGKDNIPSKLSLPGYGHPLLFPGTDPMEPLDTSRYSRAAEQGTKDAMGNMFIARGFNDANMWCAETTQPRIAPLTVEKCTVQDVDGKKERQCQSVQTRLSWAIPLEIVFLTPIYNWNPYSIKHWDRRGISTAKGRNGRSESKAFNGSDVAHFYRTPVNFYKGSAEGVEEADAADTAEKSVWILDENSTPRQCSASGPRIITPHIEGIGPVRLRFPIAPVHGEGSGVWKELNALKDMVMAGMIPGQGQTGPKPTVNPDLVTIIPFKMSMAYNDPPGEHTHGFNMSMYDYKRIRYEKGTKTLVTSETEGHSHELNIRFRIGKFEYTKCSGKRICPDGHGRELIPDLNAMVNAEKALAG